MRPMTVMGLLLAPTCAMAAEPKGCDAFKWPVTHEQSALLAPQKHLASGESVTVDAGATLRLVRYSDAKFEKPPEHAPKDPASYAGVVKLDPPKTAGTYKVTLSDAAWLEVLQDGQPLKATSFSGAIDCPGNRKSVKFHFDAKPVTMQLSDAKVQELSLIVSPE